MPHALVFVLRLLQAGRPIGYYHEKMTACGKHVVARQPLWAGVAALRVSTCHIWQVNSSPGSPTTVQIPSCKLSQSCVGVKPCCIEQPRINLN